MTEETSGGLRLLEMGDKRPYLHVLAKDVINQPIRQQLVDVMDAELPRMSPEIGHRFSNLIRKLLMITPMDLQPRIIAQLHQPLFSPEVGLRVKKQFAERVRDGLRLVSRKIKKAHAVEQFEQALVVIVYGWNVQRKTVAPPQQGHCRCPLRTANAGAFPAHVQ